MKSRIVLVMLAALLPALPVQWARAADPMAIAKKDNCTICHAVDHKVVGPAWQDIAKKYRGQAGAEAKLVAKVRNGSTGEWGNIPMPPHLAPSDNEVQELVQFIPTLK